MKSYIVIGLGRFGASVAVALTSLGNDVLAVDASVEKTEEIADKVTHVIAGDCKDARTLQALNVSRFDCAIVAISSDIESSILTTLLLKDAGVPYVVSKASTDVHARVLTRVGADKIIFPEKDMGIKLAQSLSTLNLVDFIELSDDYSIVEVNVPESWREKSLKELNLRAKYGINVVAIKNPTKEVIDVSPDPDYIFKDTDILVLIGSNDDIAKISQ